MGKISVQDLCVEYVERSDRFLALDHVSFTVESGTFVTVIGASGCGKSTLLSVVQGILPPSSGSVRIADQPVTGPGVDRGVVFQHYSLFPWMTARNNIAFGIRQTDKRMSRKQRLARADAFLARVQLENFNTKYPFQLSGGMQQRVAIARALAMDTDILLMDEPFGAIDARNRTIMQELLLELWYGDGTTPKKTVLFVTHDIDEAIFLSDKIIMLTSAPGRIYREINVPFPRPRDHARLVTTEGYFKLRNELISLFLDEISNQIGGEEVFL